VSGVSAALLAETLRRGAGVVLLLSVPGAGRSRLLEQFMAIAPAQGFDALLVQGDILMSGEQCMARLAGLPADADAAGGRAALEERLARARERGDEPVVIVDDAHELGMEPLLSLLGACRDRDDPVPVVLAGDTGLESMLPTTMDAQVLRLLPLSEAQTRAFVQAWFGTRPQPSARQVQRWYRQSRGLPGQLVPMLETWRGGLMPALPQAVAGLPRAHMIVAAMAVVLLVLVWATWPDSEPAPVAGEHPVVLPLPPVGSPLDVAAALPAGAAPTAPETVVVEPPAVRSAVPAPVSPAASSAAPQPAPPTVAPRYSADEQALLALAPGRYTLQLFGSFSRESVQALVARFPKQGIRVFRSQREGVAWYVAVTGDFRDKDAARAAAERLPADLRTLKPWARSLAGIQDELRRRRD
jgi:DamX protein